jgi:hypothetical protein
MNPMCEEVTIMNADESLFKYRLRILFFSEAMNLRNIEIYTWYDL